MTLLAAFFNRLPAVVLAGVVVFLSACVSTPPPQPPRPANPKLAAEQQKAYRDGISKGNFDRSNALGFSPQRYTGRVPQMYRESFEKGYKDSYLGGATTADPKKQVYNRGYRFGQADARAGKPLSIYAHRGEFTSATEGEFYRGYEAGYDAVRRARYTRAEPSPASSSSTGSPRPSRSAPPASRESAPAESSGGGFLQWLGL